MYILTINKGGGGIYLNKSAIRVAKKAYYMVIYQLHITLNKIKQLLPSMDVNIQNC